MVRIIRKVFSFLCCDMTLTNPLKNFGIIFLQLFNGAYVSEESICGSVIPYIPVRAFSIAELLLEPEELLSDCTSAMSAFHLVYLSRMSSSAFLKVVQDFNYVLFL